MQKGLDPVVRKERGSAGQLKSERRALQMFLRITQLQKRHSDNRGLRTL